MNIKDVDLTNIKTPCYVFDEEKIISNMKILKDIMDKTSCKILLAQKAFSSYSMYNLMSKYLVGTTASSLHEAKLGKEEFEGEVHIFAPAFREDEIEEILLTVDHIVFNSVSQWNKYRNYVKEFKQKNNKKISCGLRINPEYSTGEHAMYDPCAKGSRLGITVSKLDKAVEEDGNFLAGIEGLHFHTLCEQNSDDLESTLEVVINKFGKYLKDMKWLNFGGGHHITRKDYDIDRLIRCINKVKSLYGIEVYLEPGEACVLNAGYLLSRVLDVNEGDITNLIMDTSAACHMADVLEVPYTPYIIDSGKPGEKKYTYTLGGPTCLSGDVIGTYSFDNEVKEQDMLIFTDMALYTVVKNNTFNGLCLPDIDILQTDGKIKVIKSFGYNDFKSRL